MANKYKALKVAFLGGVEEIGKNLTAIMYGDEILLVDCGSCFPTVDTPGVDLIVPDFTFLKEREKNIVGLVITHGHEDHIGAIPYLLKEMPNIPIYGSNLALAIVEHKLIDKDVKTSKLKVVKAMDKIKLGSFEVEFLRVAHSIIGAFALAITTPAGLIFHTGDFKIDYTPIGNEGAVDISTFAKIGNRGVKLMLGESTNVEKSGTTISEKHVGKTLKSIFMANKDKRIIIATFASNVNRIQQIIDIAQDAGRKIAFSGRSMIKISEMALDLGLIKADRKSLVDIEHIKDYDPKHVCILSTGSQGEPMSALTRMAAGEDKINVTKDDLIVISSSAIPGNEKAIYTVINNLYRRGAKVMYGSLEELHVSGHACREELKMMLSLIRPQMFIPVHGEYRHLKQHAKLAMDIGIDEEKIVVAEIGDVIEVKKNKLIKVEKIESAGPRFVDGEDKISLDLVKVRKQLSNEGVIVIVCNVNSKEKVIKNDFIIKTKGIVLKEEILREIEIATLTIFAGLDFSKGFKKEIFEELLIKRISRRMQKYIKQRPVIMPIIIEEENV